MEYVEIYDVTVIRETEYGYTNRGAILISADGIEAWIPKRAIHDDSEVYNEHTSGTLIIPERLAIEKGLKG